MEEGGLFGFTVDAVAREAGVARMTVYYQFGSKAGLLEAIFDSLAVRGGAEELVKLNQNFWTWCWYVFGKIVRSELWEALDGIRSLALVPLLDWAAERPYEGYRRLERKTDPEAASRLMATVAAVEPQALYAALQAEMELFRSLRASVFDRFGLTLDPTPEEVLESEMCRRWVAREAR